MMGWGSSLCQGWGGMGGLGILGGLLGLGLLMALFAVVAVVFFWLVRRPPAEAHSLRQGRSPAHEALELRYARGELSREKYLRTKQDLS